VGSVDAASESLFTKSTVTDERLATQSSTLVQILPTVNETC